MCSALVSCCFGLCIKERGISLIDQGRFKSWRLSWDPVQWWTNRLTNFSICTNGTNGTNRPFVFAWLTSQLMRCSLQMVYRSTEELTIRSNGTNRNQSTDYFSICTNGTNGTNRPFVFAWLTSQLMRCSLQMVYRSTEELTIRSNGTNRNQSTDYFSICTNGTNGTNRPFVFARLTSVNEMHFTNGIPIEWGAYHSFQWYES